MDYVHEEWLDAKVGARCNLKKVQKVYKSLKSSHKEMLAKSCFGKIYQMRENIQLSGKLLHGMLLHRVEYENEENEEEIWFCFGDGMPVSFSFEDFTLITGLNPGNEKDYVSQVPHSNRLAEKYFAGRNAVTPKILEKAFDRVPQEDDDKYRLGLVLIYESVLRAKEPSTYIEMETLAIVEDFEFFNRYPWGRKCFNFTIHGYQRKLNAKQNWTYTLWGFPYALQVWAFECMPGIVRLFSASRTDHKTPRMCSWESKLRPSYGAVKEVLHSSKFEVCQLTATTEENEQEYMQVFLPEPMPTGNVTTWTEEGDIEGVSPQRESVETGGVFPQRETTETERVSPHGDDVHQFSTTPANHLRSATQCQPCPPPTRREISNAKNVKMVTVEKCLAALDVAKNFESMRQKFVAMERKLENLMKRFGLQTVVGSSGNDVECVKGKRVIVEGVEDARVVIPDNEEREMTVHMDVTTRGNVRDTVACVQDEIVVQAGANADGGTTEGVVTRDEVPSEARAPMVQMDVKTGGEIMASMEIERAVLPPIVEEEITERAVVSPMQQYIRHRKRKRSVKGLANDVIEVELKGTKTFCKLHFRTDTRALRSVQKELEEDLANNGMIMFDHEKKLERLSFSQLQILQHISDLQACIDRDLGNASSTCGKELILKQIESKNQSAAAVICKMLEEIPFELRSRDIVGVVALLGTAESIELSRMLAQYLGEDQMLAIVCINYAAAYYLETNTFHKLATRFGKTTNGGYYVMCLEDIRPSSRKPSSDHQQQLPLEMPTLPNGDVPQGFLGHAVNLITIEASNLQWRTKSGHGLRETLFYHLFGDLQVYNDRECMRMAQSCIRNGAVSLDGGVMRGNGVVSFGHWEPEILFPVRNKANSPKNSQTFQLLEAKKLELDQLVEINKQIAEENDSYERAKDKFVTSRGKYNSYLSQNGSSSAAGS